MNKIAAMLNLGPKNSKLAHRMQNALFGRGGKDGNNVGPPGELNVPHSPAGPVGHPPPCAMNPHGPKPPLPPGFPGNMAGTNFRKKLKPVGYFTNILPPLCLSQN